jgi:hypothetical protein
VFSEKHFKYLFLNISGTTNLKNVKTISGSAESTNLIFKKLKCNPISDEAVPLKHRVTDFYL